jgi:hypothetical protein
MFYSSSSRYIPKRGRDKTRLLLNRKCQIRVKVANGEEVLSECKCSKVQIQLKDMSFGVDAYVIILAGCDMVLGIQWLVTLGSIVWNFKAVP